MSPSDPAKPWNEHGASPMDEIEARRPAHACSYDIIRSLRARWDIARCRLTARSDRTTVFQMRAVRSSDVKARLAELLDEVEQGQTIVITRRGRPVARLVPEHDERRYAILKTMEQIEEFRRTMPPITLEEILSPRHEGHKY